MLTPSDERPDPAADPAARASVSAAIASAEGRERLVLITLAAVQFISIVDFMVLMPLGPQLMRAFEIGPAQFGLIVSSYTFAAGVAGLLAAMVIDRFSRRTAFLTFYSGFLLGTLCCGVAPTYLSLIAARIVTGAFGGILGGLAMAIIGDIFPEERRGRASGALMSAFALASVAGVPLGLELGRHFGWHVPFLALVVLGLPILGIAVKVLPPMASHVGHVSARPLAALRETFANPNHLNAFALIVMLTIGGFALIPYISPYLVANVGMPESQLPLMYVLGGALTLVVAPLVGRLADHYGKLRTYRVIAPLSGLVMLTIGFLPPVPSFVAIALVGALLVTNAGRMIAAMAMVTSSVLPARRGGFMSANSAVQHMASGVGAFLGGLMITKMPDGRWEGFGWVGIFALVTTLLTLWLAGRLRAVDAGVLEADEGGLLQTKRSVAAAAEATCDVGEPLMGP
jgi:DHA1 family inner membrane transport protein